MPTWKQIPQGGRILTRSLPEASTGSASRPGVASLAHLSKASNATIASLCVMAAASGAPATAQISVTSVKLQAGELRARGFVAVQKETSKLT